MSYTTFLGDTFEDEHDEELTRKFGDTYKYFKRQYPELYKLPTEEVRGIFYEFNKSPYGDTLEKSIARTNQYIQNHMPDWQEQYINPKAEQTQQSPYIFDRKQYESESQNVHTLNNIKNSTHKLVESVAPYIPTYHIGYGIGMTQNAIKELMNAVQFFRKNGAIATGMEYGEPSVKRAMKASDWLKTLPISDVDKHRYVSCIGATDGVLATTETLAGGALKEYADYKRKTNDPQMVEAYKGNLGIIADGINDFCNDFKGAWKGIISDNPEKCEELLPEEYRNKKYW